MMEFIWFFINLILIIKFFDKWLFRLIFQNLLLMSFFILNINFPLNNMNYWLKIYYTVGVDFYSFILVCLTVWILVLMVMISELNFMNMNYLMFILLMNLIMLLLIFCFLSINLMMFFFFFESSLMPIFMIILGWGVQVDRIQASFYMLMYTMFGSLPLFVMIYVIFYLSNSLMLNMIDLLFSSGWIYLMMMMAFLIKVPMFFVHLWLPKAHVEAPVSGSMILAGLMLKLGSYGIMRIMLIMLKLSLKFNKFVIVLLLMGGLYSSLICLCQVDMKMLVAYSSVVHMSVLTSGLLTLFSWGYSGAIMMMVAHGLCSSGLFCLVNLSYDRFKSRSLFINKGLINYYPSLSLMWFLICSSNLSFPPSLNLLSEIMLLNSLVLWSMKLIYIMLVLLFFSAFYSIYLYSYSQYGGFNNLIVVIKNIMVIEYMILMLHWIPLNLMFMFMFMYI